MLRDIVGETIGRESDMVIVGELTGAESGTASNAPTDFDVVITGLQDDALGDRQTRFMCEHPKLKVLGISGDARRTFLFELRPHRTALGDASPDGLIAAIRQVATAGDHGGSR